ncbi:methionyl-tRNA formyltransferase [Clostridia bacterium OttesenSCG-928-F22]|nr:methionyl-tRNA formyltransferase [Clostridia bacterium OttesenSCG-928-F22]
MRICFFGTPEFALPSLKALVEHGYEVVGVFTQPDKPKNRGKKLLPPPVKELALQYGIPVYQFDKIRTQGLDTLRSLCADLFVTAAYGQILSQEILDIPQLGCINVHGSLLPKYRGPAPIQWAVINGEKKTGITTMYTDIGIDTGDMILKEELEIKTGETAGELSLRLSALGADALIKTLELVGEGKAPRLPQNQQEATYFPMLKKQDGKIDFSLPAVKVVSYINGVNPWPGAYATMGEDVYKIWKARPETGMQQGKPGEVLMADAKQGLFIGTGDGCIEVLEMQAPGSKRMGAKDFLRGKSLPLRCFDE